jgi:hypothetical protein
VADLRLPGVVHFGSIAKDVAVLVRSPGRFVVERDCFHAERGERVLLARIRDAVVIPILPETEFGKDCVAVVDQAVKVSAVGRLVIFGERQKAVRVAGRVVAA